MGFEPPPCEFIYQKKAVWVLIHSATFNSTFLIGYLTVIKYSLLFTDMNENFRVYSFISASIPTHPFKRISRYLKVQKHVNKHCRDNSPFSSPSERSQHIKAVRMNFAWLSMFTLDHENIMSNMSLSPV